MSSVLPSDHFSNVSLNHKKQPSPSWLREPLLHFIVAGCLLFVADHFLVMRTDDPKVIVVTTAIDEQAKQLFKGSRGREPTNEELGSLRRVWIDNEILYREGLALHVDRGDDAIRDRVIFKALSIVDANTKLPNYDDKLLRKWFENHHDKYDEPARFDFDEAVLTGSNTEVDVRAVVSSLNAHKQNDDIKAELRVFKGRPHSNLETSYGAEFAKDLEAAPLGEWRAYHARDGWRAMILNAKTAPKAAEFDNFRGVVLQDWTDATLSDQRTAAVRALGEKYRIKIEADTK